MCSLSLALNNILRSFLLLFFPFFHLVFGVLYFIFYSSGFGFTSHYLSRSILAHLLFHVNRCLRSYTHTIFRVSVYKFYFLFFYFILFFTCLFYVFFEATFLICYTFLVCVLYAFFIILYTFINFRYERISVFLSVISSTHI